MRTMLIDKTKFNKLTSLLIKHIPFKKPFQKAFLASGLITTAYFLIKNENSNKILQKIAQNNPVNCLTTPNTLDCYKTEDKEIRRVKELVDERVKQLEFKYQGNMRRHNIDFGIRGGKYYAELKINLANVNVDALMDAILEYSEDNNKKAKPHPNQPSAPSKQSFKVLNQSKLQEDDIYSLKLEYEVGSNSVEYAKNKGSVYITGTFGKVYDNFTVCIEKQNDFSECDVNMLLRVYEEAFKPSLKGNRPNSSGPSAFFNPFDDSSESPSPTRKKGKDQDPLSVLNKNGVVVFEPNNSKNLDWEYLAGYEAQKRMIEDTILLGLTHGEVFDQITKNTRVKFETNRPKAILFEGPPGCGKTTSAKIIANQVNIPLIYMPLEAIMSKWYGESENKFSEIFEAAKALGKSIIFIDEIDALATSREDGIHEATRRVLSTLLRKIDGFESDGDVMLICATNRRKDLDPALLSRLDITITFDLPDKRMRALIFQKYAKQLSHQDLEKLADLTEKFSGRDIADICKDTERKWASMYIRKEKKAVVPEFDVYQESISQRSKYMAKH